MAAGAFGCPELSVVPVKVSCGLSQTVIGASDGRVVDVHPWRQLGEAEGVSLAVDEPRGGATVGIPGDAIFRCRALAAHGVVLELHASGSQVGHLLVDVGDGPAPERVL